MTIAEASPVCLTKGERTREKILQAAENIFAAQGYERATLRDVARAAGIHQPGIYNYFKTKRELYEAVLKRMVDPLLETFDALAALPPSDESHAETRLVDLLVANRNIPNLLIRAFLSSNETERDIAVNWVRELFRHIPARSLRANRANGSSDEDALRDIATFNAWLGYFWTAPVIEMVTGKRIDHPALLSVQKDVLVSMTATL